MITRRRFLMQTSAAAAALSLGEQLSAQGKALEEASTAGEPKRILIDAHVHVFQRTPEFPYAAGSRAPTEDAPVEKLIELMEANGVARTVLIQVIHYRWDNSYLASVLKRYPHLFHGVCRVDPEDPSAPDHLSRLTEEGFRGVRLSPGGTAEGDWIRGPLMPPLWRRCAQLKVPMTILAPVSRMPDLIPLIEANPELAVVIDHMADCPVDRPEELKLLLDLARYPKVFVKISDMWVLSKQPYPYPDAQAQVQRLRDALGAQRLMWDTNWPVSLQQLPYGRIVELYRDHMEFLTREEHENVLYRTVQRLWPFGL